MNRLQELYQYFAKINAGCKLNTEQKKLFREMQGEYIRLSGKKKTSWSICQLQQAKHTVARFLLKNK